MPKGEEGGTAMSDPMQEVHDVMQRYLDFVYEGAEVLPDCFYANSHMHTSNGSERVALPCSVMAGSVADRPAAKGEARVEKIEKIDIAGPNLAYAKVSYTTLPHYFTVGFYLARDKGTWLIAAKLFAGHPEANYEIFPDYPSHQAAVKRILAVINPYLDGLYAGDATAMLAPFTADSPIIFTDENGALFEANAVDFLGEGLKHEASPKSKGYPPHNMVLDVDMLSENVAVVKVACAAPPAFFTDYMMMTQTDGIWEICSKTTMTDLR
jgi:hypothetical protein